MKKLIVLLILAFLAGTVFATESRIEGMGKSDRYLLDEMAMYSNPAYFLIYPNILNGSLGKYNENDWPYNLSGQWFGGWMTFNNVAVGATFNRHDALEDYLVANRNLNYKKSYPTKHFIMYDTTWTRDTVAVADTGKAQYTFSNGRRYIYDSLWSVTINTMVPVPVGETDLFLGYNLGNMGVGAHLFMVMQDSTVGGTRQAASGIYKGDLGFLMKLNEKDLVDVTLTLARITYFSEIAVEGISDLNDARLSFGLNARAYLTVGQLGGQLIPSFQFNQINIANDTMMSLSPGIGYQREIEGGTFWTGLDYGYSKLRDANAGLVDTTITNSIGFGFGIEKQIAWPWFTLRVGGKKTIDWVEKRSGDPKTNPPTIGTTTNSDNDRSSDDLVGAGISFKVGEKLHFDVSANERVPFSNLFNGTLESLASRICATYEF